MDVLRVPRVCGSSTRCLPFFWRGLGCFIPASCGLLWLSKCFAIFLCNWSGFGCSMKYLEGKFHYICTYICLEKYIKDRFSIFSIYYFRITEAQYSDGNNLKPSLFSFIFFFFLIFSYL